MISRAVARSLKSSRCLILGKRSVANVTTETLLRDFTAIVGEKGCSVNQSILEQHSRDEGPHEPHFPDIVVFAESTEQVSEVVKVCNTRKVPVIPYGAGSGLEGGCSAPTGGVCIDLSKMTEVLEVNAADFDCKVQAGLTWRQLNVHLRDTGLMFPVDPGADATLGGMCSTGASGTNAVRYQTMRQNVLNCEVVLPDGRIFDTAGKKHRAKKSAAGYDLTRLFVGSEGTLGVITACRLRLHPQPECCVAAICPFETVEGAVQSVVEVLQMGVPIARIEFLDETTIEACNKYQRDETVPELKRTPTLFLEFNGSRQGVQEDIDTVRVITEGNGGSDFQFAEDPELRSKLWKARHQVLYATCALKPNTQCLTTDVCVPITKLPELITTAKKRIDESGITGTVVGHVGDGNFHTMLLFDRNNPKEAETVHKLAHDMAMHAIKLDGTCTGEHGIGLGKKELLMEEVGEVGIDVMRSIKRALDPNNIMNPGKVLDY